MRLNHSLIINSNLEKIFSYLSEPQRQVLWIENAVEITSFPNQKDSKGEPFVMKMKEGSKIKEYKGYTLESNPPKYIHILVEDKKFTMQAKYTLSKIHKNTSRLDYNCTITTKGLLFGLLVKLSYPFTKSLTKLQFRRLKRLAEIDKL